MQGAAASAATTHRFACGPTLLRADNFAVDGEAVVIGPDGLSQFAGLRRRKSRRDASAAATRSVVAGFPSWPNVASERYDQEGGEAHELLPVR